MRAASLIQHVHSHLPKLQPKIHICIKKILNKLQNYLKKAQSWANNNNNNNKK